MEKQKKYEEKIVEKCLRNQGFEKIKYEPDGNIPPDFVLNDKIAIEVRRLNQNYLKNGEINGLENENFQVRDIINRLIDKISDTNFDTSAFLTYSIKRPLPENKIIKQELKKILTHYKEDMSNYKEFTIEKNFHIELFPCEKQEQQFEIMFSSDTDAGGFVLYEIYKNIKLVVAEKECKIKKFKNNYDEWWLALVDCIGYGLSESEINQLNQMPKFSSVFSRILMVSPIDDLKYKFLQDT